MTLDVCFHPDTLRMATSNRAFRNMLAETTIDAAQSAMDRNSSERGAAERRLSRGASQPQGWTCAGTPAAIGDAAHPRARSRPGTQTTTCCAGSPASVVSPEC